jgi:hypothetical protein
VTHLESATRFIIACGLSALAYAALEAHRLNFIQAFAGGLLIIIATRVWPGEPSP